MFPFPSQDLLWNDPTVSDINMRNTFEDGMWFTGKSFDLEPRRYRGKPHSVTC